MEKQDHNAAASSSTAIESETSLRLRQPSLLLLQEEEEATIKASLAAPVDEGGGKGVQLEHYCFLAKHANTSTEVRLTVKDTVGELKSVLFDMTDIPPERQKILGLVKGKLPNDEVSLGDLQFPPISLRASPNPTTGEKRITITLIGTPIDQTFKDPGDFDVEKDISGVRVSSDVDYNDPADLQYMRVEPKNDRTAKAKLEKAISRFSFTIPIMNEPREGLKGGLLVLDLDYTIADTDRLLNYHVTAREAERPGLHEFLAAVYPYYDIVVWSQTRHWWLEAKLTDLGCLTDERYKISFVLDRTPMFSITPSQSGQAPQKKTKHQVKALEIIWKRFPKHFGPHNTVHIDDLARNFAMNPTCGLKIKPYRISSTPDRELQYLSEYLTRLANYGLTSFEQLGGHNDWKQLLKKQQKEEKEKKAERCDPPQQ